MGSRTYKKTTGKSRRAEALRGLKFRHVSIAPMGRRGSGATLVLGNNRRKRSSPEGRREDVIRRITERFQHALAGRPR